MRMLWLLLALAACGQAPETPGSGPYVSGGSGINARVGGSFGGFYSHTR